MSRDDAPDPKKLIQTQSDIGIGATLEPREVVGLSALGLSALDLSALDPMSDVDSALVAEDVRPVQSLSELATPPTRDARPNPTAQQTQQQSAPAPASLLGSRYILGKELGRGGMGCVYEAFDSALRRQVAIKVLHQSSKVSTKALQRFVAEAQVTSQLEHPSIVPVHDMGSTEDGAFFYVMKRIRGEGLDAVIKSLREGAQEARERWTQHRLMGVFLRVCEAVAYAHARGVLHRDLKPANVMLGEFGEVLVLDWGVARLVAAENREQSQADKIEEVKRLSMTKTVDGMVIGTPAYMSPEQARGENSTLDQRSDVWALGAILYELLTWHRAFDGNSTAALFKKATGGLPDAPRQRAPGQNIPESLEAICVKAMHPDADVRHASAAALAADLEAFQAGSLRRAKALEIVAKHSGLESQVLGARSLALMLRTRAQTKLAAIPRHAAAAEKKEVWALEDEAAQLERQAALDELAFRQAMHSALSSAPDLDEPHILLADHYQRRHLDAERRGDAAAAAHFEVLLKHHDRGQYARYLSGQGSFTLFTEPQSGEATLFRYEVQGRRKVPVLVQVLGLTPLREVALPMGSYLLEVRKPGWEVLRYPVLIERDAHWSGALPGAVRGLPIKMFQTKGIGEAACYVPGGWFWAGGDAEAFGATARKRMWVDGFVMERFPVTNARYIAFLNDLCAQGREDEALQHVPRERAGTSTELGSMIYGRDEQGNFVLRPDADGDIWLEDYPVLMVSWHGAMAFARWESERSGLQGGLQWRLPSEWEWEKAARGVDARAFPWGDHFEPSWCCMRDSHPGRPLPATVTEFPEDDSPYGVRGLAGNAMDWCLDVHDPSPSLPARLDINAVFERAQGNQAQYRSARGGSWYGVAEYCRAAGRRHSYAPFYRFNNMSFRLARSV